MKQPETEITVNDLADFDYLLLDKTIKTHFEDERIMYWDSEEIWMKPSGFLRIKERKK